MCAVYTLLFVLHLAAVLMLASWHPCHCCSCVGRAIQLHADCAATQAAAVQAAWQIHQCQVIIIPQLTGAGRSTQGVAEVCAAVEAALAAGVSVIASADGFADLTAVRDSAQPAAVAESMSDAGHVSGGSRHSSGGGGSSGIRHADERFGSSQQYLQQQQLGPRALWTLLCKLSSDAGRQLCSSCTVVECVPGYR